ncbi:imelysin family protein [Oceanisphaera pacifica]|uniref:Imelysin family protein n=1 Tax=Oceanisphaera pacifica TaxID=2818389 RepID=A0ABS3NGK7_9GAMM|nr:imelysin family protein [Oceanisphaera pacifica]MBO1519687.1 imelysin family protein [Oceanisphaera pacifica]
MKISCLVTLLATVGTLSACQHQPHPNADLAQLTTQHLSLMRQQADQLTSQLTQLQQSTRDYCQTDASPAALAQLKTAWRSSFAAWSAHQGQSATPLDAQGLSYAFQFWPDKKDTVGKQVRRQLAAVAEGKAAPDRGVVTTLSAVEYLLESELSATQQCLLLPTITQTLTNNAKQLQTAWHNEAGYQQQLAQMAEQGGKTVLLTQMLGQLSHRYDRIEKKLVLPLNTAQNPRPLFAEAWRSQQSLHFLRTSLTSLEQEYRQGGIRSYLLNTGHHASATAVDEAFASALTHLPSGNSLAYSLKADNYAELLRFNMSLDQLGYQLKQRLPSVLGLSLGFNATDGD